ncbi:MAG: hypothetical protein ACE5IB_01260 [Candidatus Geothermarchaeales archaeon]
MLLTIECEVLRGGTSQFIFLFFPDLFRSTLAWMLFLGVLVVVSLFLLSRTGEERVGKRGGFIVTRQERLMKGLAGHAEEFTTNLLGELERRGYGFEGADSEAALGYSDFYVKVDAVSYPEGDNLRFGYRIWITTGSLLMMALLFIVGFGILVVIGAVVWFFKYSSLKDALAMSAASAEILSQTDTQHVQDEGPSRRG